MGKLDGGVHFQPLLAAGGRIEPDAAQLAGAGPAVEGLGRGFADFNRFQNLQVAPPPALALAPCCLHQLHKGRRAAVQDGQLQVVELHRHVVNPAGVERRQQVFGGGDQHTFFHQAGGVAHPGDVGGAGFDLEPVQVHPPEQHPGARRRRAEPQAAAHSRMQPRPRHFHRACYCVLVLGFDFHCSFRIVHRGYQIRCNFVTPCCSNT